MPVRAIYRRRDRNGVARRCVMSTCEWCGNEFMQRRDHEKKIRREKRKLLCASCVGKLLRPKDFVFAELPVEFWAYMAGFFDGEGCLHLQKTGGVIMSVTQVNRTPLDFIIGKTGFGKVDVDEVSKKNPKWHDSHTWRVTDPFIIWWFLKNMRPYLQVKNDEVRRFVALQKKRPNWEVLLCQ